MVAPPLCIFGLKNALRLAFSSFNARQLYVFNGICFDRTFNMKKKFSLKIDFMWDGAIDILFISKFSNSAKGNFWL
jgi:hypothetical protein